MRIEPIALYGGGSSWSSAPVGRVKPISTIKRPEAEERRSQEVVLNNNNPYGDLTKDIAVRLNDRQAWNYSADGSMASYDVSGAGFDAQV